MTSPDSLGVARPGKMSNRSGLWIMHDIDIVIIPQRLRAALIHAKIEVLLRLPQIVVPTLQGYCETIW